jgi:hypothetical protein
MGTVIAVDGERMVGFGYKTGWLAFAGAGPGQIVAALGGRILGPRGWTAGVDRAYGEPDAALITPTVPRAGDPGWILVAGRWIAEHADGLDIAALSAELGGQVQLFVTHRVVELHRWERAVGGELVRSFEYVGERSEITRWRGQPREVELSLGLPHLRAAGRGRQRRDRLADQTAEHAAPTPPGPMASPPSISHPHRGWPGKVRPEANEDLRPAA